MRTTILFDEAGCKNTLRLSVLKDSDGENWLPEDRVTSLIYQGTPAKSPARHLLVDLHVSHGIVDNLTSETCHLIYMAAVARALTTCAQDSEHANDFRFHGQNADDYLV